MRKVQTALQKTGMASILFCDGPLCRRFALEARWLRRDGIYITCRGTGRTWLCSTTCLGAALSAWLQASVALARVVSIPPRMPFRLALLRAGAITDAALQAALERSRQSGVPLGKLLLAERAITAEQLAAARAAESGCAHYTLPPAPVPGEFALPPLLALRFGAAMLHASSDRCVLGFVERIDRRLMAMVETIMGLRVEAAFITEAYQLAQRAPAAMSPGSTVPASQGTHTHQAAVAFIAEYASKSGAEDLSLAVQPGLLWARFARNATDFSDQVLLLEEQPLFSEKLA